jgi:hypothetical protein
MVMSSGWRVVYFWVVNACCVFGVLVPLALLKSPDGQSRRWIPHAMAWTAAVLLTLRGVAGLIVDRSLAGIAWDSMFLVGGILFSSVAWLARNVPPSDPAQ